MRTAPVAPGIRSPSPIPPAAITPSAARRRRRPEDAPFVQMLSAAVRSVRPDRGVDRRRAVLVGGAVPGRRGSASPPSIARPATSASATRSRSASSFEEYFDGIVAFAAFLAGWPNKQRDLRGGPAAVSSRRNASDDANPKLSPLRRCAARSPSAPWPAQAKRSAPAARRRRRLPKSSSATRSGKVDARQTDRRAALAHVVRFRERGHRGRQGRIRAARHLRRRPDRRRLRRRQAEERRRDHSRQEAERDPRAAARSRHFGRGVQAGRRGGRQDRPALQQAEGLRAGQGLCDDRHRRSVPDGQARRRRARGLDRQEGQGRLDLSRRRILRDQPARQGVQDDDREGLSRHQDRRRRPASPIPRAPKTSPRRCCSRIPISTAST